MKKIKLMCLLCFSIFGVGTLFVDNNLVGTAMSYSTQPPPQMTGAPGEQTCALCHDETGPGTITINAPTNYVPGQTYQIQVQHATTDMTRQRWGFEMTALDGTNAGTGSFSSTSGFTQLDFADGREYIEHTETGTFAGTGGGATWSFNWTAPATDVGPVTFYAAGNQANNNNNPSGDQVYVTTSVSQPAWPTPTNTATATNTPTPTPTCYTVTTLQGSQEVPPNGSTGTGTGTVSLSADLATITVNLSFSGLGSPATAAHIHGPAAAGSSAGIVWGMTGVPNATSGSIPTQSFAINATQRTQLQNGLLYWNVHSTTFGAGEIRGQILTGPCVGTPTPTATSTSTFTPTNTATATNTPTATPTGAGTPSISGVVTYGNAAAPPKYISNVTITGTGSTNVSTTTAAPGVTAGQYTLTGFGSGSYTVSLSKTTGQNGIGSNDAARIAQHVTTSNPFTTDIQKVAADVTGNGAISSQDAAKIAQVVAGLPSSPPNFTGQWRFFVTPGPTFPIGASPTTRSYSDPIGVQTGQDYIGLLIGETTGNWAPGPLRPASRGPQRNINIELPNLFAQIGKEIEIPVIVSGASDKEIISYEFNLRYDPMVIQPLGDAVDLKGTASRGLSVVTNAAEPGLLRVVVYGAMPIDSDGVLLNLRFTAVGTMGSSSPLTLERLMFNEGEPRVVTADGKIDIF